MMFYAFIEAEKANFPIRMMCTYFGVKRSSYYDWVANKERHIEQAHEEALLINEIHDIHAASAETYGEPRITQTLRNNGYCINHKRVERLMAQNAIVGIQPNAKKRTTVPAIDPTSTTDLVKRAFSPKHLDEKWCGDITYIRTREGWLYLATVIDMCSRMVIGYAMADHMRTALIGDALRMAVTRRGTTAVRGTVFHHDRGSQYMSQEFADMCTTYGIRSSCSAKGVCFDNAVAESFFGTLKNEYVHRHTFRTRQHARLGIFTWIATWYNTRRLHSTLGYQSPQDYETQLLNHGHHTAVGE